MTSIPASPAVAEPSAGPRAWKGLWVLASALAMIVLDGTIVAVALPSIIADLRLDLTDAQWVNSLYSVVFAALLLTAGRLGDRWGRRRLLLIGLTVFVAGNVLAALAVSVTPLLMARAVQGIGGAMVLPSTLSSVNATFRGPDRAAAFGVWGAVMAGAAALGPLVGGVLTQFASWPLIFWVNVPIGIAVIVGTLRLVDETSADETAGGVDWAGPLLSAAGLGLIVFGLIESSSLGWWTQTEPLRLFGFTWPPPRRSHRFRWRWPPAPCFCPASSWSSPAGNAPVAPQCSTCGCSGSPPSAWATAPRCSWRSASSHCSSCCRCSWSPRWP